MGHRQRLDDIVKGQIKTNLKCGMTPKAIAEVTEYHQKHIEKMQRNLWQWGSVTILRLLKIEASRQLTAAMTEVGLCLEMWA